MDWTILDTWIVITGALIAMACAIPGIFLFLSRQSMFGHGVVHAVLPGIIIAFLITHSRDLPAVIIGAIIASVLTGVFTQMVHHVGKIERGASLGIVFTSLFALGILLIRFAVDTVHIDPDCVLFGVIETAVIDDAAIPSVTLRSGAILLINLAVVALFFKELRIGTFDPALAKALGLKPNLMNYGVMIITAITAVLAFESVGSILVIAMMIGPAAAAYLLTHRLLPMIFASLMIAALTAIFGHLFSLYLPSFLFQEILGMPGIGATNTAGGMAVVAGMLFIFALFFSPKKGVISKWLRLRKLSADPKSNAA